MFQLSGLFYSILADIQSVISDFLFYEPSVWGGDSMWFSHDYLFPSIFKFGLYTSIVLIAFGLFRSFTS